MKRIFYLLPLLAACMVLISVLAFKKETKPRWNSHHRAPSATVWLRYDCTTGEPALNGTSNVSFSDISGSCTGTDGNLCTERYNDLSNLEPIPGQPGFYRPKSVNPVEPEQQYYCPE